MFYFKSPYRRMQRWFVSEGWGDATIYVEVRDDQLAPSEELPPILEMAGLGCALAGLTGWIGNARNAGGAIRAVTTGTPEEAHRPAEVAGWCSLAQMSLGFLAVGLAWFV
jgi:hypothetical protein